MYEERKRHTTCASVPVPCCSIRTALASLREHRVLGDSCMSYVDCTIITTHSVVENNTHFYPAVSVCQESGHCPTGSSVWGLARLHERLAGCVLIRGLDGGRICFSAPSDCWLNSFPCESRVYFHLFL